MQVQFKTTTHHHHSKIIPAKTSRASSTDMRNRPLTWRPQPSGLTRDETRELVLEMIG